MSILVGRAWYYINGENIDVAASAREAVREMIPSGVLGDAAGQDLPEVTKKVIDTVIKSEL